MGRPIWRKRETRKMSDWKETLIADCIVLQKQKAILERERAEDEDILNAEILMNKAIDKITELKQPYGDKINDIIYQIDHLHEALVDRWNITDKTYECEVGTAILRTTKALKIEDKKELISILLNLGKLPESIRTWNLAYLRKLKDVDMIEDTIAYYEEHQNVIIKGVGDK